MTAQYDPTANQLRSFHDARPAFADGDDRPRDYLERCLEVIEAREPTVQAFVALNLAGARQAADRSSARYRAGRPVGPVDGLPVGIKDLLETDDMPTAMGSPIYAGRRTGRDAAAVRALRQAGAVIVGKTVTTEFGFFTPGPTRNPHDPARTPGGSSSGSAAAVGAGMLPLAIGTQVVGSVIRPSSFCGTVAFKPTMGALNRGGAQMSLSQNHIGLHAAALADAWAAAHAIAERAGGDPGYPGLYGDRSPAPPRRPTRLIRIATAGWAKADDASRAAFERAIAAIAGAGVEIIAAADDPRVAAFEAALEPALDLALTICGFELRWPLAVYRARGPGTLSEQLDRRVAEWATLGLEDYRRALDQRALMRRRLAPLADLADGLITLAATGPAPEGLEWTGDPVFNAPATTLGTPAITLPLLAVDAMPLGLQLIGFPDRDADLFGIAAWLMDGAIVD